MIHRAWIGLGSNLGDRRANLESALDALAMSPGVVVRASSSFHETPPVGGPPGQGPFLNAAAGLETGLDPESLLATLRKVEDQSGRVRAVRWGERTLDLDLLIFGNLSLETTALRLPHPRLAFRRFVLGPLAEIAPDLVDPTTRRTIADLLANLDRRPWFLAIDGPPGPRKAVVFRRLVEELPGLGLAEADLGSPLEPAALALLEPLALKAEALRPARWPAEGLRVPWVVADFFLDFDIRRASEVAWREDLPRAERAERREVFHPGLHEIQKRPTLVPTLAVVMPGDPLARRSRRRPLPSTIPLLWPESDDPDAILAEILATCRGIEGP